ncbi:uncharacterized protein LOC120014280 [Tripterygium wilfordii]|uniref:uncharacterized protein LOC120014280 n=1 Tax=Tripterygium wilfordii TaxID=458696 RepID=UPI0018F7F43E|nr:uncharacterized protein LOC120014280 [Tripterygium wilfordii]
MDIDDDVREFPIHSDIPSVYEAFGIHNLEHYPCSTLDLGKKETAVNVMRLKLMSNVGKVGLPIKGRPFYLRDNKQFSIVLLQPTGEKLSEFLKHKNNYLRLFDFPTIGEANTTGYRLSTFFKKLIWNVCRFILKVDECKLHCKLDLENVYVFETNGGSAILQWGNVADFVELIADHYNQETQSLVYDSVQDREFMHILDVLRSHPNRGVIVDKLLNSSFFWDDTEKIIFFKNMRDYYAYRKTELLKGSKSTLMKFKNWNWVKQLDSVAELATWKTICDGNSEGKKKTVKKKTSCGAPYPRGQTVLMKDCVAVSYLWAIRLPIFMEIKRLRHECRHKVGHRVMLHFLALTSIYSTHTNMPCQSSLRPSMISSGKYS